LQGLNKAETAAKHGEDQVLIWRRSYGTSPPPVSEADDRFPGNDPRYAGIEKSRLPKTECLRDTVERVTECWNEKLSKEIRSGKRILIVAHGNSLRALVEYLDQITDKEIIELNIPTGIPLVYELDSDLTCVRHYYLADEKVLKDAMAEVATITKKVICDHRLNMTLFRWPLTVAPECWFSKLRINIIKMSIVTVCLWHLAQRLKI
jgi:2,3-bisphosphoglycerate-dependent phosphoglycerate mutase